MFECRIAIDSLYYNNIIIPPCNLFSINAKKKPIIKIRKVNRL